VRLFNRRFTRLTLGYSKKFEYLIHSINLMVFHFNFVHINAAHKQTPAQAAGLASAVTQKWVLPKERPENAPVDSKVVLPKAP